MQGDMSMIQNGTIAKDTVITVPMLLGGKAAFS